MSRFFGRLLLLVTTVAGFVVVFLTLVRPWYLDWGATADERTRVLPGDEIVANAASQNTRAITIRAPIADVWPWLAQVGQDRGGFYSFDLLENLVGCEMPTVDVLRIEDQGWQLGDKLWMYPPDKAGGAGYATLRSFVPGRVLGFGTRMVGTPLEMPENGSWTFVLEPIDSGTTRLLIRGRGEVRHSLLGDAFDRGIFEPIHFMMERRMLIGLAQIAETGTRHRTINHVHIGLWAITAMLGLVAAARVLGRRDWRRPLLSLIVAATSFQILTLRQPSLVIGVILVAVTFITVHRSAASTSQRRETGARRLRRIVVRHPTLSYFLSTFAISWGGGLLVMGGPGMAGTAPASDPRFAYALAAMLAGPSVSGILMTALVHGRAGLRRFAARLTEWRAPARWYAVALFTAPVLMTATLASLSIVSPAFRPGVLVSDEWLTILVAGAAVGLSAGIVEELGWTGFAVPSLRSRHGLLATGMIVGVPWGAWHLLPNFWARDAAAGELPLGLYALSSIAGALVGYLPAFRVLMVWVHDRTGSLPIAMIMHTSLTASLLILNPIELAGARLAAYSFLLAGAIWAVVAAVRVPDRRQG